VDLIALDDPVFVIELTPAALERCRRELSGELSGEGEEELEARATGSEERPIRAVALLLEERGDPLLLGIEPTFDLDGLNAAARLVRAAAVTGCSLADLAAEGHQELRELYLQRRLPAFIYEGVSEALARRLPPQIRRIFDGRRHGASG
jgi:hypothetical protein